ncbi:hypothetical protein ACFQY4_04985 [Catellatospora bangladeshensis]|uniref:hypothetical protein n=1 Tax=Catellatospora bangladeshensis TaxID=310355 RepID=UPI0036187B6F
MKEWIAGLLAVLGTLLVLAGATVTVVKTLTPDPAGATTTDPWAAPPPPTATASPAGCTASTRPTGSSAGA